MSSHSSISKSSTHMSTMDSVLVQETARLPKVTIPPRRTSSLYSRSNSKSQLSKTRSIRREKLRRSLSVNEKSENHTPWSSPVSPTSPTRFSAPPSPFECPIYFSVEEVSNNFSYASSQDQDWPLTVPRLSIPTPGPRLPGQCNSLRLQVPRQSSDDYVLSPHSPLAYTPLVSDHKFFTAIPISHHNGSDDKSLLPETADAIPKSLSSLSKKGVKRTPSTRNKGHKRGKTPLSQATTEILETQVQNPNVLSGSEVRSESPPLSQDDTAKDSRPRKDSLGSPLRPARRISRRRKDGNFLPLRAPAPSFLQPLAEEPTALERKKMPLVTAIVVAPCPTKITKTPGPLRRFSTRRRRRTEAVQKPLPALPTKEPEPIRYSMESDTTFAALSTVGSRPMSPAEFEEANTSPPFPGSSFGPKPTSPWSQLFKRAKSPSAKDEKSPSFLGMLRGKPKERDIDEDEVREKGKIRVVGTVNMRSAFED